jgi:hypothetical protein
MRISAVAEGALPTNRAPGSIGRRRGRPKGSGNRVYRQVDLACLVDMGRMVLADPRGLSPEAVRAAAREVAPRVARFTSDRQSARRLARKFLRSPTYYLRLACERDRPHRPSSLAEIEQSLLRPILDARERVLATARILDAHKRLLTAARPFKPRR